MLVSNAALQSIFTGYKTLFQKAFAGVAPQWSRVATAVPSNTKKETYAWLGVMPRLKEWIGDRAVQKLMAHDYTITNKKFELTVEVGRDDIEDDSYGVYAPLISELGSAAASHPDELVFGLLGRGFNEKCYDGQPFFSAAHKDEKITQSNLGTADLSLTAYAAARTQMMSLKDAYGKPLGLMPNLLVVPPALEGMGRKILNAETLVETSGQTQVLVSNVYKGSAELLVAPQLGGSATAWYLMDASRAIRPLIFQERKKPEFTSLIDAKDENVFLRGTYLYGVDSRCNVGFGLWQMAYGSTGAG
jgi:phage major head subunit gpT-like protein